MRVVAVLLGTLARAASAGAAGRPHVTMAANVHVSGGDDLVLLGGSIFPRRAGQLVTIEADDCGPLSWRPAYRVRTAADGGWRSNGDTLINTRYRARWKRFVSRTKTKLHRNGSAAELGRSSGTFRSGAHGKLRAILPAKQAALCYTTGISANINA